MGSVPKSLSLTLTSVHEEVFLDLNQHSAQAAASPNFYIQGALGENDPPHLRPSTSTPAAASASPPRTPPTPHPGARARESRRSRGGRRGLQPCPGPSPRARGTAEPSHLWPAALLQQVLQVEVGERRAHAAPALALARLERHPAGG